VETLAMAGLMAEADIAIGAGGSSTWERACLGLPAIDLILADNQRAVALALDRQGATLAVEVQGEGFAGRMTTSFARLCAEAQLRTALSSASAASCDGEGSGRVADAILALVR
jgi:spore coat polysaccharide biosynthesis predicted glycosyltransferase SpsG